MNFRERENDLYPSDSKPGVLQWFAKILDALEDGTLSFQPILSATGTAAYNLAKFCDVLLKPLARNDYKNKEVLEFDASFFRAIFYIKSLSMNITLT